MTIVDLATQKLWMNESTATVNEALVLAAMNAADRAIQAECGRQFTIAGAATARVYTPTTAASLEIDDCTSVTSISNFGATVSTSTYQLEPLNALSPDGEAVPYTRIRLLYGAYWYRLGYQATITVTATWGWTAIPFPVVECSKWLAKEIYTNRDSRGGAVSVGDAVVFLQKNSKALAMISDYRRGRSFGFA